ncbi:hypothetical protein [Hydrogenophaga sp.]|uniref:hypothetical protein n=1 Tax=Hydrogenophaga sp. TaxID=1904254 RepID=UPI0026128DCE|nr:hypothetical protein [Hydrogenophaga sp.]MDM7950375.1 hypothetical protein [Hydrogenophaga sp.]
MNTVIKNESFHPVSRALLGLIAIVVAFASVAGCGKKPDSAESVSEGAVGGASNSLNKGTRPNGGDPLTRRWTVDELQPFVVGFPSRGVILGQAYDFVDKRWLSSNCVSGKKVELGAGEMTVKFHDLYDRRQIFESLKIEISAEGSFGGGSASASSDFARTSTVKAERRNVMVTVDSMKNGWQLAPEDGALGVKLSALAITQANKPADPTNEKDEFRRACGDGFAVAIRNGARLSGVFSFLMDSTEVSESLKVGASGGYGPVKAKASIERLKTDLKEQKSNEMTLLQVGGNRDSLPTTVDSFLANYSTFGKYTEEQAVPLEVVVIPYKALSDLPIGFKDRLLPDLGVRGLSAHYWRLLDLSALYARASMSPQDYYHPYIAPGDSLVKKARDLQNAARCVNDMLEYCSSKGTQKACTIEGLLSETNEEKVCIKNQTGLTPIDIITASELALGRSAAVQLLNSSPRFKNTVEKAALDAWMSSSGLTKVTDPRKNVATLSEVISPNLPDGVNPTTWKANVYDLWFMSLAQAPWPRIIAPGSNEVQLTSPQDLHSLIATFCNVRGIDCTNLGKDKNPTPQDINNVLSNDGHQDTQGKPSKEEVFRSFIVATRLFPISSVTCDSQIESPLCQLPDVLHFYVSTANVATPLTFGGSRWFSKVSPPPPPANVPKKDERTPRPPSRCDNPARCPFAY